MSPSAWIAAGIVALAALGLWLVLRKNGTRVKDEIDPEAPRNLERRRAASEAAAAADKVLSDADAAEVAELHEYFQEIGTGEFPVLAFQADPLGASPLDTYWRLPAVTVEDAPLFRELTERMSMPSPPDIDGPTGVWAVGWIDSVLAGAKEAASR